MHDTAAEAKAINANKMGDELGALYSALWQEVAWLYRKWADYVALFGTSEERIELLNKVAPALFRTMQDSVWEDVLLHLARLTDPSKSAGKKNLSVKRLSETVQHTPIGHSVERLVASAHQKTAFARDWRNRKLAHRDLDLAIDEHAEPLAPASRAAVKQALQAIAAVLNAVAAHYLDSTTIFELGFDGAGAEALLGVIENGLRYRKERRARAILGGDHWGDLDSDAT